MHKKKKRKKVNAEKRQEEMPVVTASKTHGKDNFVQYITVNSARKESKYLSNVK